MSQGFLFHAFATGFAGRINRPFEHLIEAQAPSALPPVGGYSSSRVEHFRYKEILSFRAAYTQVAGSFVEKNGRASWDTVMTSTVEGLEVMGVVKADRIVARLTSRHDVEEPEPEILPIGSRIEGLQIAGVRVDIDWDVDLYSHHRKYSDVVRAYSENIGHFRDKFDAGNCVGKHRELPEMHRSHFPWAHHEPETAIKEDGGPIATTLVGKLSSPSSFLESRGHVIHLPQFGNIIIGQFLIDGNARQLTMLQIDPACAVHVSCSAGSGQTNGQPVPPIPHQPKGN